MDPRKTTTKNSDKVGRNRDIDVENKRLGTKGGKWQGVGGGGMNWEIGIDIYTLICIK